MAKRQRKPMTEEQKIKKAEYRKKNHHQRVQYMRDYRLKNPDKSRSAWLKRCYGISIEDYKLMSKEQNGLCKICDRPESSGKEGRNYNLAIDHCHETGKIRGLLCQKCNVAIGLLNDDVELVKKAFLYLSL